MKPVLMHTDTARFNETIKRNSIYLGELTEILQAFNVMNIGTLTGAEFQSLVTNPPGVVFDKMTKGQDVVIGGLKINKAKALDILERPKGYNTMLDLIEVYKNRQNWNHHLHVVDIDLDGNEIVLKKSFIDQEAER